MKHNLKKGFLLWITGLSGSGKTSLAKKLHPKINKLLGPTIILSGDNFRRNFDLKGYSSSERLLYGKKYTDFLKLITDQKINVIFAVVGLFDELRKYNRKKINNYLEIFIKADIDKIKKSSHKKHYLNNQKNIVGIQIKPEFPKKPEVTIENNFSKSLESIANEAYKKIKKVI